MSTVVEIPTPEGSYIGDLVEARPVWKDAALEFVGTLIFVYISLAGVNQVVLSGSVDQFHIATCFALGLSSGIIVAGRSGGHLNPAVSLTVFATSSDFGATRCISYMLAQICGGFTAGLLVLAVYYSAINNYPDAKSIGSFGTLKDPDNSLLAGIIDQFVGSALLMFGIVMTPLSWSKPLTVGTILGGLGMFQGKNGFAFNAARDISPRLASSIVFGSDVFSAADHWFWVPAVIPFFGVPFGWLMAKTIKSLYK